MQFIVIVKATADSEAGIMPTTEEMAAMGNFNEELVKAGVMKDGAGLHPTSKASRIVFKNGQRSVVEGPFHEENLISGYWLLEAGSRQEVVDLMIRCPNPYGGDGNIEIRQLFDMEDFGDAVTPEIHDQIDRMHAATGQ
jgi:hypothetical protein